MDWGSKVGRIDGSQYRKRLAALKEEKIDTQSI